MDDLFAHPIGFIPRFPPPPKYIKVKAHSKKQKTFDKVFLAQELSGNDEGADPGKNEAKTSNNAVWAMVFSKDGKYLATAGQDKIVRVWAVITNAQDREAHEQEEEEGAKGDSGWRLTAPVFKAKPIREYTGHTGSVLDLSWSKVCCHILILIYETVLTATRTTSFCPRQWIAQFVCGTLVGPSACAASNIATL
jgi:WD40 repeat protein